MGRIQDKVAIVTGGGDGIGHAICRRFAAEGAKILVAELNADNGARVADELRKQFDADARFIETDVARREDNEAMVDFAQQTWGTVDILVNNAWGGGSLGRVEFKTLEAMQHGMSVGFYGPLWAMQRAFPLMKQQGWGRVINICSLNGVNAHMGTLEYNCAKEALRTLTRTAAREWAETGITCNVICPGAKTASSRRVEREYPEMIRAAEAANPMKRLGDPEADIAPVALFLASEDCQYLTGNTLYADGGSHINGANWSPDLPDTP
jgi:NAD(P)-dependent dehydrogenase (short-subunit alcohol dehydrogenase family)